MVAAYQGHAQLVQWLLGQGADADKQDAVGRSAALAVLTCSHADELPCTFLLIQNGRTALIMAAAQEKLEIVSLLLEHGADPRISDSVCARLRHSAVAVVGSAVLFSFRFFARCTQRGANALQYALAKRSVDVVRALNIAIGAANAAEEEDRGSDADALEPQDSAVDAPGTCSSSSGACETV
jgi:ankyrin repeat protein